ncbi:MAG: transaldolase family protein [Nanoarchaeota archaeon]
MRKESGIFFDSANLIDFKKWFDTGILGGATTNPVILQKDGVFNIPEHIEKMVEICGNGFPISIEVPDSNMNKEEMVTLALVYTKMFPTNAVIKIPMDPRDMPKALGVMTKLKGLVKINATLGLTAGQLIGAMETGAEYVSLFWGRCDEAGRDGAASTLKTVMKYRETHNLDSKIIIGSIRKVEQIDEAFVLGADIVTIPPKLIEEWMFTQRCVETADQFNQAYRDVQDKVTLI